RRPPGVRGSTTPYRARVAGLLRVLAAARAAACLARTGAMPGQTRRPPYSTLSSRIEFRWDAGGARMDGGWRPTACVLCASNCGIEVKAEGRRLARIRGDKAHPASRGYTCEK